MSGHWNMLCAVTLLLMGAVMAQAGNEKSIQANSLKGTSNNWLIFRCIV